jgi:malonate transporter
MSPIFSSLIPVFLVIAAGWAARVTGFVEEKHWPGLEKVTYLVFFPAVIIEALAKADLSSVPLAGVGGALVFAILAVSALLLALRRPLESRFAVDGPSFTSIFQGSTRWNTFVGLALAGSLYGTRGLTLMAVAIAAMVPLLNILAIAVLVRYAGGPRQGPREILRTFVTNPFIWSCAIGLALNFSGLVLPKPAMSFVEILGKASLAAGLLVVGAGLDIRQLARPTVPHAVSSILKLAVLPALAIAAASWFGVTGADLSVAAIAACVPTASGGYILARQMGGNAPLMAEIITVQTVLAMATMPLAIGFVATF